MTITAFLQGREVERQAVTRYINRHPEIFEGHTRKEGKEIDLDEYAVDYLAELYPLIKPVTLIQGVPQEDYIKIQGELIEAHRRLYTLSERLSEAQGQLSMANATQMLLEDKERLVDEQKQELSEKDKEIAELRERLQQSEVALATERAKTWWQKLRGK